MVVRKLMTALVAACIVAATAETTGAARSTRTDDRVISSRAGALHYEVYLPDGYATSGLRYPVLYFLHGLPAAANAYRSFGWVESALERTGKPAILVLPQGARAGDTDPEYLDHGAGREWGTAISVDLPKVIDSHYRTIATRSGRGLIGVSAGGYGAMHLAFLHLRSFRAVESWSGYFKPTNPAGTRVLDLGSTALNAAANVHKQALEARLDRYPLYIAFYVGRSDPLFVAENAALNQELSHAGIAHVFRLYPGGHQQSLWSSQATAWRTLALNHLAPASG
jgi:S-formylglutathione hydrolase FrmB